MNSILITGGTVFVSRYIAEYYVMKGWNVYVLNRNTREQPNGVKLIKADRHDLGMILQGYYFDVVVDNGYTSGDVESLLDALGGYGEYILISSSAVYPDHSHLPFREDMLLGPNKYWGKYGTDKIGAEATLHRKDKNAYVLRPPYLYGPMNNVYREAFVFDCALSGRKFFLPGEGKMKLQFFHIYDLCRFIDAILSVKPEQRIFNVGNKETISIREWVEICYGAAGEKAEFENVYDEIEQRNYFSFYNYEYYLDVSKQNELMSIETPIIKGIRESFEWYRYNTDKVVKKPYIEYIDTNLIKKDQII